MPEPLSKIERRILDYLIAYLRENTYQPSVREIGRRFDIKSTKTVSEYLQALADKGWIQRDPARSRGVRILAVDLEPETVTVPLYGGAVAGSGSLTRQTVTDEYQLDRRLAGAAGTFLLPMPDDGMTESAILEGDLLLMDPVAHDELEEGDIVAARSDGKTTVRRYRRDPEGIVLEATNALYAPVRLSDPEAMMVLGRVVGVLRRLRAPAELVSLSAEAGEDERASP